MQQGNKVKPRDPRVPSFQRAEYLHRCVTGYISRLREVVPPSDSVAHGIIDDFEASAREIAAGREPRKARR